MSDFSRKDEAERKMPIRTAGQTEEIEDGLEWIEESEELPEKFISEVEITEDRTGETKQRQREGSETEAREEEKGFMPSEEDILRAAGNSFTEPVSPEKNRLKRDEWEREDSFQETARVQRRESADPAGESGSAKEKARVRGRSRRKGASFRPEPDENRRGPEKGVERSAAGRQAGGKASLKRRFGKKQAAAAGAAAAVLVIGGAVYAGMAQKYKTVFFPGTQINGLDVSGKTAAEAEQMIAEGINGYVLAIEERGGETEQISQSDIGLQAEFDGTLEKIIAAQKPLSWGEYVFSPASYKIQTMMIYDDEAFETALKELKCLSEDAELPENAHLSEYKEGEGYSIVSETEGTRADYDKVKKAVSDAILKLETKLSLEEAGVYEEPEITAEDETLKSLCENMNRAAKVTVTYQFGDKSETLDGSRIHQWLIPNEDGTVGVDSGEVSAYVKELAEKYNTGNKAKTLKTSYGKTVTIRGGTYGWKINQSAEADELAALIRSGESQSGREPVYSQKAASHGENDYGDTYVEINLTAQHLFFYKNGSLLVESDFVSGNLSKGWGTPAGAYPLTYKQRDAVLKGEGYRTPVDYWMPFNGGIGMHDATWRSSFGGTIYKTGGSHGCINLPHSVAKKIYENISAGMPVLCYNLEGTEQTPEPEKPAETKPPAETTAPAPTEPATEPPAETTAPAPTEPATEAPAETTAPAPTEPATEPPAGPASDNGGNGDASGPGM